MKKFAERLNPIFRRKMARTLVERFPGEHYLHFTHMTLQGSLIPFEDEDYEVLGS